MPNTIINILTKYNGKGFDQVRKDAQTTSKQIKSLIGGLGFALGAREIFEFAKRSEEAGREMSEARTRLTRLLGSTEAYNKAIADMNRLTTLQSSEVESAQAAFLLLDSRIASSTEEAAKLANAGSILSNAFEAQGASEEKFLRLLTSGNDVLLDNFNLTREQVKQRQAAIEATGRAEGEEAKLLAVRELAIEKSEELAGSISDETRAAADFDSTSQDLIATIGEGLIPIFSDAKESAAGFFGDINELAGEFKKTWGPTLETMSLLAEAQANIDQRAIDAGNSTEFWNDQLKDAAATLLTAGIPGADDYVRSLFDVAEGTVHAAQGNEELAEEYNRLKEQAQDATDTTKDNTDAVNDNAEALEEAAKRMEKVSEIRQDFARSLIEIDEQAQEDTKEAWEDFFDDNRSGWADHLETVADLKERSAEAIVKIDDDLQKDLEKNAKKLQKDLAKVNKDESKQIEDIKRKAATDDRNDDKRRKIDVLADERLFNFELKQLAAEGNANAIKEALERREIEEQIAKEKAQVEQQIEDTKLQDDIRRVRDAAQERRSELQTEAAERASILRTEAEETKALREEQLQEELEAEREKLREEVTARREALDEKLKLIEEGKNEAISKLAEELTETGDLTRSELAKLVPVAGEFGDAAGAAFAEGMNKSFEENERISGLLGEAADFRTPSRAGTGGSRGITGNPGIPGFRHGVQNFRGGLAVVGEAGPELVNLPRGSDVIPRSGINFSPNLTVQINGPIGDTNTAQQAAEMFKQAANDLFQEFVDDYLVPVLGGE